MATFNGDLITGGAGEGVPSSPYTHLGVNNGNQVTGPGQGVSSGSYTHHTAYDGAVQILGAPIVSPVPYYKMRGRDVDCGPITYRTWVVQDMPDPTETFYAGPRCGATPFADIVIAEQWQV
jgi:hypothetical protein